MRVALRAAAAVIVLASGLTAVAAPGIAWAGAGAQVTSGTTKLWAARYHGPSSFASATALAASPDGADVFVTGMAMTRQHAFLPATVAYNAATGAKLWSVVSATGGENVVAVSPDSATVYAGGSNTVAYNAATGAVRWTQPFPGNYASRIAVSPNGKEVFATGYGNGKDTTVAYSAATGVVLWTAQVPSSSWPGGLVVSPDSGTVYVAGSDFNTTQYQTAAYDAATGSQLWIEHYRGPFGDSMISSAVLSPDGSQLVVTGQSAGVGVGSYYDATVAYAAATGATNWSLVSHSVGGPPDLAISPDGSTLYLGGQGGLPHHKNLKVTALTAASGGTLWTRTYGTSAGNAVESSMAISPDGSRVYLAGWLPAGYLTLAYDAGTGAKLWQRDYPNGEAYAIAADPDGSAVFVTGTGFPWSQGVNEGFETVAYGP